MQKNQKEERTKSELPYAHKHEKSSAFDLPLNEKVWQLKPTVLAPRFSGGSVGIGKGPMWPP